PDVHAPSWHAPPKQLAAALAKLQAVVHTPQWLTSVLRLISQPLATLLSQLPNPLLHAMAQAPPLQDAVPLVPLHTVPHPPQLFLWLAVFAPPRLASSESKLRNPLGPEPIAQAPVAHVGVALARVQETPQPPQLLVVFRLVSQPLFALPSQLANP